MKHDPQQNEIMTELKQVLKLPKTQFYSALTEHLDSFPELQEQGQKWADDDEFKNVTDIVPVHIDMQQVIRVLQNIFSVGEQHLRILKHHFLDLAAKIIKKKLQTNKIKYIEYQQEQRIIKPFIEKVMEKMQMDSVKEMKAFWYEGINNDHKILPGQPIKTDHILALTFYTHDSKLCTAFRETYRKMNKNETMQKQIKRHSKFAYMGRLLYESFVFYGSTNSAVELLYHGINLPLSFNTLYCTFDAPTSTTTASSVATTFGSSGIVVKLESNESTKYIKTLDM
eukprot:59221_1